MSMKYYLNSLFGQRDRIAASTDGNSGPPDSLGEPGHGDFSQIDKSVRTPCKIVEVSAEKMAVETIRAKVSQLNDAIAKAVEFGIKVEIDTLDHYRSDRPGCPATTLLATISKTL